MRAYPFAIASAAVLGTAAVLVASGTAASENANTTAQQLMINQRISQAAVRRSNSALNYLAPVRTTASDAANTGRNGVTPLSKVTGAGKGWTSAQIADGAITSAKIASGVLPRASVSGAAMTAFSSVALPASPADAIQMVALASPTTGATQSTQSGAVTTTGNTRVMLNASVSATGATASGTGTLKCHVEMRPTSSSAWSTPIQYAQDGYATVQAGAGGAALTTTLTVTAAADLAAGSYDARVMCQLNSGTTATASTAVLTVIAVPR
jgi:hypothetical protein